MKRDPVRLFDDPRMSQTLRDDLRAAEAEPGLRFNVDVQAQRLSTRIASDGAAATSSAAAKGAEGAAAVKVVVPFGVKVVGVAIVGLVGGAVMLQMLRNAGTTVSEGPARGAPPPVIALPPPALDPPSSVAQTPVTTPIEGPAATVVKAKPTRPTVVRRVAVSDQPGPSTVAPTAVVAPVGGDLKEEMSQLAEIRALARTNPARAVEMVQQGHARFTRGVFWQEREVLAITSLVALGRQAEARRRAVAALDRHPESPFAETLRHVIAGEPPTPTAPFRKP